MRAPPPGGTTRASYGSFESRSMDAASTQDDGEASSPQPAAPLVISVDSEIDHIAFGRFQVLALAILGLANASDAVELLCLSFILPQLNSETGEEVSSLAKSFLSAAIFVGMLVGGLVFGIAADTSGRRSTLSFSLAINAFFGLLSAATPNYGALVFFRVMAGFGVGGSIPGVFTLAAEVLPNAHRGFWLSTVAWWWMVGSLYAAGLAWLTLGVFELQWQFFAALCAIPAGAGSLLVYFLLPESPRFLHTKGDSNGAVAALMYMAKINRVRSRLAESGGWVLEPTPARGGQGTGGSGSVDVPGDDAVATFSGSIDSKLTLESSGSVSVGGGSNGSSSGGGSGSIEFAGLLNGRGGGRRCCRVDWQPILAPVYAFFHPSIRRTSLLLLVIWFALSFGWYGLILWIPTLFAKANVDLDVYQDSFLVAASNLPGNLVSALLMDRVGRKGVLCASLVAACLCAVAFPFATSEATVLLASCLLNAVSTCSWNSLDCLSTESFPTNLRTTALGLLAACGRLGSIAGQLVFGNLIDESIVALLVTAAVVLGGGAVAAAALPREVKGARMHET